MSDYRSHVRPCFNGWLSDWLRGWPTSNSNQRFGLAQQLRYIRMAEGRRAAIGYCQIVRSLSGYPSKQ